MRRQLPARRRRREQSSEPRVPVPGRAGHPPPKPVAVSEARCQAVVRRQALPWTRSTDNQLDAESVIASVIASVVPVLLAAMTVSVRPKLCNP